MPDRPASGATILFQAATDACVLPVIAEPPRFGLPSFDLSTVACRIDQIVGADGCRHMVLHDGPSRLRLDLLSGDLLDGPVSIRIRVDRLDWSEWIWTALRRLRDSVANGRLAPQPVARCGRRDRLILALRCWDARQTGASHRDLAALLVGPARARAEWRSDSDHLRSRVRRVLRGADRMIAYGWRTLLAPVAGGEAQASMIGVGG